MKSGDFSKDLVPWMSKCLKSGGVPIFKTRYAGLELEDSVLGICYGAADVVGSIMFHNVPREDVEKIRTMSRDWIYLAEKYGDRELKELVQKFRS